MCQSMNATTHHFLNAAATDRNYSIFVDQSTKEEEAWTFQDQWTLHGQLQFNYFLFALRPEPVLISLTPLFQIYDPWQRLVQTLPNCPLQCSYFSF